MDVRQFAVYYKPKGKDGWYLANLFSWCQGETDLGGALRRANQALDRIRQAGHQAVIVLPEGPGMPPHEFDWLGNTITLAKAKALVFEIAKQYLSDNDSADIVRVAQRRFVVVVNAVRPLKFIWCRTGWMARNWKGQP